VAATRLTSLYDMRSKTTLILLAIAIAAGVYIKYVDSNRPDTQEAARRRQNVINFDREKITGISIQNGDDKIEIKKTDDKWRLEAPIKDQADSSLIDNLVLDLESWQKETTIPAKELEKDKSKLTEFGLGKPKLRLKLLGENAPPEILLGKDAALDNRMYVRLENSKDVFLTSQTVRKDLERKAEDFRDRKLTTLTAAFVTRIVLKTPAGEMELEKKTDHWEIAKPLRARADDQKVGDLIAQITTAHIQQFVADDRGDLHPYGLAEPRGSITLFAKDDKAGQMLQIGGVPERAKDQVYARFAPRNGVYELPNKIADILNAKPNDLRDRHLIRIDTNILDRITIDAAGKGKTVLARKGEEWTIASRSNQPANSTEVNRLLEALQGEQVAKFVEDVASNLGQYGLDKPPLQITFSSFASENTAETQAGEHPFATIAFGKLDGENVYARLSDEPFVVAVRRALLDNIFADPIQWQDLAIFKFKPEQIHRLSVTTDHELALTRGANNQWTSASVAINQRNIGSLLNTLSTLHAVRWVGPTTSQHGLDKPPLTIAFTTSPDDKSTHKLLVGGAAGTGMWCARVEEHEGTFVINNSDLNVLKLPLVAAPAPSPAVSSSSTPSAKP
jgi:hypothetical protein